MGLVIPGEAKQALAYLRSIDISLGRIATALEKQAGIEQESEDDQRPKKESAVSIMR